MVTNPSSTVKSAVGNNVYNTLTNYIYSWITVNNNSNNNNSAQSVSNIIRGTNSMTGNKRQSCYMSKELDQPISLIRSQIQYSHTRLTNSAIYVLTQLALVTERAIRHRGNVYGSTRPSSATPSLSGQGSPRSASHSSLSSNNSNNTLGYGMSIGNGGGVLSLRTKNELNMECLKPKLCTFIYSTSSDAGWVDLGVFDEDDLIEVLYIYIYIQCVVVIY